MSLVCIAGAPPGWRGDGRGRREGFLPVALLTAMFVLTATGSARAADMPPVAKAPPCAASWWQGWHVGLNVFGGGYTANRTDQDGQLVGPGAATYTRRQTGLVGGGLQGGYDWAACQWLMGVEADGGLASMAAPADVPPFAQNPAVAITSRFNTLLTVRGRLGVAVSDSLLIYVTGGAAAAHTLTTYLNRASEEFTFSDWRWGWTGGVGADLRVTDNLSLRSEALYVGLADRTDAFVSPTLGLGRFTHSDSIWLARVGINVKLGFDPGIPTY